MALNYAHFGSVSEYLRFFHKNCHVKVRVAFDFFEVIYFLRTRLDGGRCRTLLMCKQTLYETIRVLCFIQLCELRFLLNHFFSENDKISMMVRRTCNSCFYSETHSSTDRIVVCVQMVTQHETNPSKCGLAIVKLNDSQTEDLASTSLH